MIEVAQLITDFISVARLAGIDVPGDAIEPQVCSRPHAPPSGLPVGKMAVYVFFWGNMCLKVGKVGPRSNARYTSQHYSPLSSKSNLAKSILNHGVKIGIPTLDETTVGEWIKKETDRVNFLLDKKWEISVLSLLESFLQCRLRPKYEGFISQS